MAKLDRSRHFGQEFGDTGATGRHVQDEKVFDQHDNEVGVKPGPAPAKPAAPVQKPADDQLAAQLK